MHRLLIDRRRTLRTVALEEIARQTASLGKNAVAKDPALRLAFAEQLAKLEQRRPLAAEVLRYRFFLCMTLQEIADKLDCSVAKVHSEVAFARAFLARSGG